MRQKGSKVCYFWTIDPSGTCVKAVCSCLSQRQHGVGCQVKPCGCDCPSQLQKIPFSNFQALETIAKFCKCSSFQQLNIIRNSGGLKTGFVQNAWKVWGQTPIKTVWERIHWNPLWKWKIMSRKLNISTQSSCASSGTIYTWERTSAQRDISLLLLWRKSDGQEQNVSSSGTPRTGTKTSSSRNYLARKVDILFRFPSRSQSTWDRTYGRTVYIYIYIYMHICL